MDAVLHINNSWMPLSFSASFLLDLVTHLQMNKIFHFKFILGARIYRPIPVAAWSKVWVCGRSLAGIVGLNPVGGMDICLL
jgi:hypothetical protein